MYRVFFALIVICLLVGCQSYVESTKSKVVEGDHRANYNRVFREEPPSDIVILNSAVVIYEFRTGVVTTDDFEFELLVPAFWIESATKRFHLQKDDSEFIQNEINRRRKKARSWYAPKSLYHYDLYRDATSVGYAHMLVEKTPEADGRRRVFLSKH